MVPLFSLGRNKTAQSGRLVVETCLQARYSNKTADGLNFAPGREWIKGWIFKT